MKTVQIDRLSGRHLRQVTTSLEPGLHVLLALDPVGTDELIPLLDGSSAPRRGGVLVDGRCPYRTPELRSHIGSLWSVESLPRATSVRASLQSLKLDPATIGQAEALLFQLGHSGILDRAPRLLRQHEIQLVALAVALSKPDPWAWLLFEPLLAPAPQASGIVAQLL